MNSQNQILTKSQLYSLYLEDPKSGIIEREIMDTKMQYFYFDNDLEVKTERNELLNGCLLSGDAILIYNDTPYNLHQFDIFFLSPGQEIKIKTDSKSNKQYKICLYFYTIDKPIKASFEVQHFDLKKFIPRGENSSKNKMSTYRAVWTAIKNRYFMSGYTNIPNEALKQGVITSVNLEANNKGNIEIYPHIHPEYPEVYIICIDDENYSISQYLINTEGQSVCKDLSDGEGLFFPGNIAHSNFARPFYKDLRFCMYYWCIPTFGVVDAVSPITIKV